MSPGMCDLLVSNVWHPRSVEAIKKEDNQSNTRYLFYITATCFGCGSETIIRLYMRTVKSKLFT